MKHLLSSRLGLGSFAPLVLLALAGAGCRSTSSQRGEFAESATPGAAGAPALAVSSAQIVPATISITNRLDPNSLLPPSRLFTLGPGDRLEIQIVGQPTSRSLAVVGPDGKIYYDLLPGIDVWGLTLAQARARLEQAYSQYVRETPQISLLLREVQSRRVWILGRVQAPGVYPLAEPMTLLEAISLAGGTMKLTTVPGAETIGVRQDLADLNRSFLVRSGRCVPVNFSRLLLDGDTSQNIALEPDDFLYFPAAEAQAIYVLGAVNQPRAVSYRPGMTIAGAVAGAYGALKGAYISHVALVRGSLTQPRLTIVDLSAIIRGKAPDVPVLPDDIVYVPLSPYRYIEHYVNVILDTFVSTAAIDEGEKVVGVPTGFSSGGVLIPVGSGIQIIPPASPPPIGH